MKKFFRKILFLYLFISLSSYACQGTDENEIHWNCWNSPSSNPNWHEKTSGKIKLTYENLQSLDTSSLRNVATFQVALKIGSEIANKSYEDTMFISGGNAPLTKALESKMKIKALCISHYCPVIPSKPKDFELRKNIVEFFDFQEDLTKKQKTDIHDAFSDCISGEDYFSEMKLSSIAISKLLLSLDDTLCYRQFDEPSNRRAQELGLINKTSSDMNSYEHINDLFGKNFQLNFGDSEQTIRLFLAKNLSKEKFIFSSLNDEILSKLQEVNETCKVIQSFNKNLNKENADTVEKLKECEHKVLPLVNAWVNRYLQGYLEIASYYSMCNNCQATFKYDFNVKKHVARTIFIMFINSLPDKNYDYVKGCLKGWLFDPPKSGLTLSMPKINLIVSSLRKYGD